MSFAPFSRLTMPTQKKDIFVRIANVVVYISLSDSRFLAFTVYVEIAPDMSL